MIPKDVTTTEFISLESAELLVDKAIEMSRELKRPGPIRVNLSPIKSDTMSALCTLYTRGNWSAEFTPLRDGQGYQLILK